MSWPKIPVSGLATGAVLALEGKPASRREQLAELVDLVYTDSLEAFAYLETRDDGAQAQFREVCSWKNAHAMNKQWPLAMVRVLQDSGAPAGLLKPLVESLGPEKALRAFEPLAGLAATGPMGLLEAQVRLGTDRPEALVAWLKARADEPEAVLRQLEGFSFADQALALNHIREHSAGLSELPDLLAQLKSARPLTVEQSLQTIRLVAAPTGGLCGPLGDRWLVGSSLLRRRHKG